MMYVPFVKVISVCSLFACNFNATHFFLSKRPQARLIVEMQSR